MRADRPKFDPGRARVARDSHPYARFSAAVAFDGDRTAGSLLVNNEKTAQMSRRNGDRARFQKDRKRKLLRRQRIQELMKALRPVPASVTPRT